MKERPILFSAHMVRALLDGSKTQTRRIVKPHSLKLLDAAAKLGECHHLGEVQLMKESNRAFYVQFCPYGKAGDRLWVREAWARTTTAGQEWVVYREGDNRTDYGGPWKPGIHMFRKDSRILLEIISVRVERLQDISEADARAEGCTQNHNGYFWGGPHKVSGLKQMPTATSAYQDVWEFINGAGSWDASTWVWVVEFRRLP